MSSLYYLFLMTDRANPDRAAWVVTQNPAEWSDKQAQWNGKIRDPNACNPIIRGVVPFFKKHKAEKLLEVIHSIYPATDGPWSDISFREAVHVSNRQLPDFFLIPLGIDWPDFENDLKTALASSS